MPELPPPNACVESDEIIKYLTQKHRIENVYSPLEQEQGSCLNLSTGPSTYLSPIEEVFTYRNSDKLQELLKKEQSRYLVKSNFTLSDLELDLNELIEQFYNLDFKDVDLQITPFRSIKITFLAKEGNVLSVHKPFDDLDLESSEFIVSVRVSGKRIFNGVMPIEKIYDVFDKLATT